MNTKKQRIFVLSLVLVALMAMLASCSAEVIDFASYIEAGEDNLNFIAKIAMWMHGWIGQYGWTVIVFTLILKVVTLPLDVWQRFSMRKQTLKMQELQPLMEAIDKRYGTNSDKARMEKQKIQQKQSASALASCLPLIVSMLIMIFMFGGLRQYATYQNILGYHQMESFYSYCYETSEGDLKVDDAYAVATANGYSGTLDRFRVEVASKGLSNVHSSLSNVDDGIYIGIAEFYLHGGSYVLDGETITVEAVKESFLWMQSMWQPDTWASIMPSYADFSKTVTLSGTQPAEMYNLVREQVLTTASRSWNGLLLFPVFSVGIMFLSMWITQQIDKKNRKGEVVDQNSQQAMSSKMNMILMPLMFGGFGFFYTGAVSVYITTSYIFGIFVTLALKPIIQKMVDKSIEKAEAQQATTKASYKR